MAEPPRPQRGPVRRLVVMAKEPRAGAVKTRLARDIGAVAATAFYRRSTMSVVTRLARDRRWRTALAVTPDSAVTAGVWPRGAARIAQGAGDLGARMQRIFDRMPPGPVVVIGTDIPQLQPRQVAAAFRALGANGAVFGPADDGGYWLVGLRRSPGIARLFGGVRWSSPHALADTLANLKGRRAAMLETLSDVDDGKSHRRLKDAGGRVVLPPWRRSAGG